MRQQLVDHKELLRARIITRYVAAGYLFTAPTLQLFAVPNKSYKQIQFKIPHPS